MRNFPRQRENFISSCRLQFLLCHALQCLCYVIAGADPRGGPVLRHHRGGSQGRTLVTSSQGRIPGADPCYVIAGADPRGGLLLRHRRDGCTWGASSSGGCTVKVASRGNILVSGHSREFGPGSIITGCPGTPFCLKLASDPDPDPPPAPTLDPVCHPYLNMTLTFDRCSVPD